MVISNRTRLVRKLLIERSLSSSKVKKLAPKFARSGTFKSDIIRQLPKIRRNRLTKKFIRKNIEF